MGIFDTTPGPFANPDRHNDFVKHNGSDRYTGGLGGHGDGLGHGHGSDFGASQGWAPRPPVSDFLGNLAIRNSGEIQTDGNTPRWGRVR